MKEKTVYLGMQLLTLAFIFLCFSIAETSPIIGIIGGILGIASFILVQWKSWKEDHPKVRVKHAIDYPEYYNEEEFTRLVVTQVRGSVLLVFDEAAFFTLKHGWEHIPIFPPKSPDVADKTLIIKYEPESLYPHITGSAVRSLNGKWYYSKPLNRKYRKMNFKPEPEEEPESDPNNPPPF